jgi:hypothetical protein
MHRHTKRLCQVVAADKEASCEYVTQTARDLEVCVRSHYSKFIVACDVERRP